MIRKGRGELGPKEALPDSAVLPARCAGLSHISLHGTGNPVLFPEKYMKLTGKVLIFLAIIIIV